MNQQINLYQVRFRKNRKLASADDGVLVLALTLFLMIGASIWYHQLYKEAERRNLERTQLKAGLVDELDGLRKELQVLLADKRIDMQVQKLAHEIDVRRRMIDYVANNQLGSGAGYAEYLGSLTELNVAEVWLHNIQLAENQVSLAGSALNEEKVPEYFSGLQQRALFAGKSFELFEVKRKADSEWKVDFRIASRESAHE